MLWTVNEQQVIIVDYIKMLLNILLFLKNPNERTSTSLNSIPYVKSQHVALQFRISGGFIVFLVAMAHGDERDPCFSGLVFEFCRSRIVMCES
jgi:hypothetical protein